MQHRILRRAHRKAAQRPRSEAQPSEVRAPAGKAAQRPRSEAQPSEVRAPAGKAAQRPRSEAQPSEVRAPARAGGFTLLEISIALGVFAVGMLGLAAMQLHAMRSGSSGRHATQAAAIAQSQMEQLQRLRWTDPGLADTAGAFTAPITQTNTVQGDPDQVEMTYTVDWRIADVETDWTRAIDVRVTWDEDNRPNRTMVLSSIRYNREGL